MPIKEGYIAKWNDYPKDEVKVRVAHPSFLGPSKELLKDVKEGKIEWPEYERRFREEILKNPKAVGMLRALKKLSKTKTVRLICYEKFAPCHRFILIEMIKELED